MRDLHTKQFVIAGRSFYVEHHGTGTPPVVLESGAGDTSATWSALVPALSQHTQVMRYDRAGLGLSSPANDPTLSRMVADLALLVEAVAAPPYILVGHSLGGLIMYHFAQLYPSRVAGLVLLDAPHPKQTAAFHALFSQLAAPLPPPVAHLWHVSTRSNPEQHPEGLDFIASLDRVAAGPALPAVPLIVISRGRPSTEDLTDIPPELANALDTTWHHLQAEMARLSPLGTFRIAEHSGHYIHDDQPDIVLSAIVDIVQLVRTTR